MIELLVVIAVIGILAGLLLPALGKSKSKAQGISCLNNLKQLALSWKLYTDDNAENLPGAAQWGLAGVPNLVPDWCGGSQLSLADPRDENNWNHEKFTRRSLLWPFGAGAVNLWRCPSDHSLAINAQGRRVSRIRSYSMNNWVGGPGWNRSGPWVPKDPAGWSVYRKTTSMVDPGPSGTFVLLDEREDSIDDGCFMVDMYGYPARPENLRISDFPASYHNRAGGFVFADSHAEFKKWQDPRTTPALSAIDMALDIATPRNADVGWLQERATRLIP